MLSVWKLKKFWFLSPEVNRFKLVRNHICSYYDIIVIGDSFGGLAAAKEASSLGAKVALVSCVTAVSNKQTWSSGETYVHSERIPKKLWHRAALLGDALQDAKSYGWLLSDKITHNWDQLKCAVQIHIKYLKRNTKKELKHTNVTYLSGPCRFVDSNTIRIITNEEEYNLCAKYFLIALNGIPKYPNIPGAVEYGISSDDIFKLENSPRKTLIIGAGYVGLEYAGILNLLGNDTTVLMRSVPLRGLDQQMASLVKAEMQSRGVHFLTKCLPTFIHKLNSGKLKVTWIDKTTRTVSDEFDTVVFAVGQRVLTRELELDKIGVQLTTDGNDKIKTLNGQTNVAHVYAIGDAIDGRPELTAAGVQAGQIVARRLFKNSKEVMIYENIPTTIFTPLEYGFVGLSEEKAIERFGLANLEVYHSYYKPAEYSIAKKSTCNCYLKVIASRESDQKVLGMHFVGPQAGEIIQGFSAALKCGLTIKVLVNTVGIHPTLAEEFIKINITKRSGKDPTPASCCS